MHNMDYDKGENVELKRDNIAVNAVVVDKRVSFGHTEYKLKPLSEGVEINGWVRKFSNE